MAWPPVKRTDNVNVPWPCLRYCGTCPPCVEAIEQELQFYERPRATVPAGERPAYCREIGRNAKAQGATVDGLSDVSGARAYDAAWFTLWTEMTTDARRLRRRFRISNDEWEDALGIAGGKTVLAMSARERLAGRASAGVSPADPSLKARFSHWSPLGPWTKLVLAREFLNLVGQPIRDPLDVLLKMDSGTSVPGQAAESIYARAIVRALCGLLPWVARLPQQQREFMRHTLAALPDEDRALVDAIDTQLAVGLAVGGLPHASSNAELAASLGVTETNVTSLRNQLLYFALGLPELLVWLDRLTRGGDLSNRAERRLAADLTRTLAWCATLEAPLLDPIRHALADLPDGWRTKVERSDREYAFGLDIEDLTPSPGVSAEFTTALSDHQSELRATADDQWLAVAWVYERAPT